MKLHKSYVMLMVAAAAVMESYPAFAQAADDAAAQLPGPGILGLVVLGIGAAAGIARSRK